MMINHNKISYPCLSSKMLRNFCHYLSDISYPKIFDHPMTLKTLSSWMLITILFV